MEGSLREIRTLKNVYNNELSQKLENSLSSTSNSHLVSIDEMLTHFRYNPILRIVPGIRNRFWEQMIVDVLINNNDRNNGNWGILYENGIYRLAPVFDNGAAFLNKLPDNKLQAMLSDEAHFEQSMFNSRTIYLLHDKQLYAKDIITINNEDFYKTAVRIIPIIQERLADIVEFIWSIPDKYNSATICSPIRKDFYMKGIVYRLEHFLLPIINDDKKMSIF